MKRDINYTMLFDFYELTMGNGYFQTGLKDRICYFDVFFRNVPDGGGFAIAAGLEQVIDYILHLEFTEEDIAYLRTKGLFSEEFLNYLRTFRFTGDLWAVPEGTPIFPHEPILTVRAPAIQAQFIETFLLLTLNHQSSSPPSPTVSSGRPRDGPYPSSAPGGPRARTAPFWGPGPPTSPAAPGLPAPWPTRSTAPPPPEPWPTPGCRCSTTNTPLS